MYFIVISEVVYTLVRLHPTFLKYAVDQLFLTPEDAPVLFFCAVVASSYQCVVDANTEVRLELHLIPSVRCTTYHGNLKYSLFNALKYSLIILNYSQPDIMEVTLSKKEPHLQDTAETFGKARSIVD